MVALHITAALKNSNNNEYFHQLDSLSRLIEAEKKSNFLECNFFLSIAVYSAKHFDNHCASIT